MIYNHFKTCNEFLSNKIGQTLINHRLAPNSPNMSHKPGGLESNPQERRGSTSECLTISPKEAYQKSNRQEPVGSTSDHLTFLLKKIWHVRNQNNIAVQLISNTYETELTQRFKSLHQKYEGITKIHRYQNVMKSSL